MAAIADLFPECRNGPIRLRFDRFLERVLYAHEHGYYSRRDLQFGRLGDFYTSPHVHFFFAEILSEQFLQVWEWMGSPGRFVLLEMGPGDATLAFQLLDSILRRFRRFSRSVRYIGLEVSATLAERQRRKLERFDRAEIICRGPSFSPIEPFQGCIFSNEFFDALPFRRFRKAGDAWLEWIVEISREGIRAEWEPTGWQGVSAASVPSTSILEWREAFESFYDFASAVLKGGMMLHLDYGDGRQALNPEGTMRTFQRHRMGDDPFVSLGEQDITASVDFSHLLDLGRKHRFQNRLMSQREYLIERGILEKTALRFDGRNMPEPDAIREKQALKDLILPGGISDYFKVLIQERLADG